MPQILKPFGPIVARIVIEVDALGQTKVEGFDIVNLPPPLQRAQTVMHPLRLASLLSNVVSGILLRFKQGQQGGQQSAEKTTESPESH